MALPSGAVGRLLNDPKQGPPSILSTTKYRPSVSDCTKPAAGGRLRVADERTSRKRQTIEPLAR